MAAFKLDIFADDDLALSNHSSIWDWRAYSSTGAGDKDIFSLVNKLLQGKVKPSFVGDTTYNCGNFYVTTIKHPAFEGELIIPIVFMLHERRFQDHHEMFMEVLIQKFSNLK